MAGEMANIAKELQRVVGELKDKVQLSLISGSYTQLKDQGPSGTCNESKEDALSHHQTTPPPPTTATFKWQLLWKVATSGGGGGGGWGLGRCKTLPRSCSASSS